MAPMRLVGRLLLLMLLAAPGTSAAEDLTGLYDAVGQTTGGHSYKGSVQIRNLGALQAVLWRLDGGEAYKGIGIRIDDLLGAAYGRGSDSFGLVVYRIRGGALEGTWAGSADLTGELGRETLQGPASLDGEFQITLGQNRDGVTNYAGMVAIKPNGKTYLLEWFTPKPSGFGVGIRVKDVLVVAYGANPKRIPGVVVYRNQGAGFLIGDWTFGTLGKLGSETLTQRRQ